MQTLSGLDVTELCQVIRQLQALLGIGPGIDATGATGGADGELQTLVSEALEMLQQLPAEEADRVLETVHSSSSPVAQGLKLLWGGGVRETETQANAGLTAATHVAALASLPLEPQQRQFGAVCENFGAVDEQDAEERLVFIGTDLETTGPMSSPRRPPLQVSPLLLASHHDRGPPSTGVHVCPVVEEALYQPSMFSTYKDTYKPVEPSMFPTYKDTYKPVEPSMSPELSPPLRQATDDSISVTDFVDLLRNNCLIPQVN